MKKSRVVARVGLIVAAGWLCVGCESSPSPPPPKPQAPALKVQYQRAAFDREVQKAILAGEMVLACVGVCAITTPVPRFDEMIDRRDWQSLGLATARYGVPSDITYYHLAQAALGQNAPSAATKYADLASLAYERGERCSGCDAGGRFFLEAIRALKQEAMLRPRATILLDSARCVAEQEPEQLPRCKWSLISPRNLPKSK